MKRLVSTALFVSAALAVTYAVAADGKPRFEAYVGPFAYGLRIVPPWVDGGYLEINLPEHLERVPGGHGVLRHNDRDPRGHWTVSSDGDRAVLDVPSPTISGVSVLGTAKVRNQERIDLTMRITNASRSALTLPKALYCNHYASLTGFPQHVRQPDVPFDNFHRTYVVSDGQVKALSEMPTRNPQATRKGAIVRGCPQNEARFAKNAGGFIEAGIDAAIAGITSRDAKRSLIVAWSPGKSLLSNAYIPCLHADPYYGEIAPGDSATAKGVILLTNRPIETVMKELIREGVGTWPTGDIASENDK